MPTRLIREGILDSERVGGLSERAELFYRKLMSIVDDFGRFEYIPSVLRARLYSQRLDSTKEKDIVGWMNECETDCADRPLVVVYRADGKVYLEITDFKQQTRSKSKCPEPPLTPDNGREQIQASAHSRAASPTPSTNPHSSGEGSAEGGGEVKPLSESQLDREFDEDWPKFWVRVGVGDARAKYKIARRTVSREKLMNAVVAQGPLLLREAKNQGRTPLHPATWLHQGRYGDDLSHVQGLSLIQPRASPRSTERAVEKFIQRELRESGE